MLFIRDSRRVTVAGGGGLLDVTMNRQGLAFRELTVYGSPVSSRIPGDGLPAYGKNFTTEVFFGPTSQGAAIPRTSDDNYLIFDPGSTSRIWPANEPTSVRYGSERQRVRGFPITVRVINNSLGSAQPTSITGVVISAIGPTTSTGSGTLSFTAAGTLLDWQAPGAGAPGAAQNVGAGGTFTLAGGDGSTIDVFVVPGSLPAADQSDAIAVYDADLVMDIDFTAMTIVNG